MYKNAVILLVIILLSIGVGQMVASCSTSWGL